MGITNQGVKYKKITSSTTVTTAGKTGLLYGLILVAGTTLSKLQINDGGSGGGIAAELEIKAQTAAGDVSQSVIFDPPVVCETDIYATLAGTSAVGYVYYREIES